MRANYQPMKLYAFTFYCLVSLLSGNPILAQSTLQLSDLSSIVGISSAQLSPAGDAAVFITTHKNFEKNIHEQELVWINLNTKEQRTLVRDRKGLGQPRWSPKGDQLSFMANTTEGRQIFLLSMNGGEAQKLTSSTTAIKTYAWSPDGNNVAYVALKEAPPKSFNNSFEVGSNDFLKTEQPLPSGLWLFDVNKKESTKALPDSINLATDLTTSSLAWSPDSKKIAFSRFATPFSGDSDLSRIFVFTLSSGRLEPLTENKIEEGNASFSRDGSQLAFLFPRDGVPANQTELHRAKPGDKKTINLTSSIDRAVSDYAWLDPGDIIFSGTDGVQSNLWLRNPQGDISSVSLGEIQVLGEFDSNGKGKILLIGTEQYRPAELYLKENTEAPPVRLTNFNDNITKYTFGKTERMTWKSTNNLQPDGVVTYPPFFNASQKYPLVVFVHGGPTGSSDISFHGVAQAMAAKGWIVFQPNYRGSDNLGNTFQSAIANDAAEGPGQDIMSGVNELLKKSYIDRKKVAISGWSYGGWMTNWMIGRYPELWTAAVSGAGPVDYTDMYSLNDLNRTKRHAITDSPYKGENLQRVYKESPISNLSKIRTPTLIMSNTGDSRVTITGSYKLFHALRDNNVPVQFIAYPTAGHFPPDPIRAADVYVRWLNWLEHYLGSNQVMINMRK